LYPDDVEAWFQLGEILFHAGRLFGRPLTESRDPFDRVIALEPEHATALIHLVRIAAVAGDATLADSLADRVLRLNPGGDRVLEVEALRLDVRGAGTSRSDLEAALSVAQPAAALQGVFSVYEYGSNLTVAEQLLEGLLTDPKSPELRRAARVWLGHARAVQGQWRAALDMLAPAGVGRRPELLVHRAFLATLPFFPMSADTLRSIGRALTAWNAAAEPPSPLPSAHFNVHDGLYPAIRLYLLGLIADRLGDSAATHRFAEQLGRGPAPVRSAEVVRRWELGLRARVLVARGRPAEALALLEPSIRAGDYERKLFSPFFGHTAERFLVGTLLAELGRVDDARVWLGSLRWYGMFDRALEAPAAWRIARIFDQQRRADSAAAYYARVVDLWGDADPALQPVVADARSRLVALRGDR
jgi:tetratricopeptide (TPR) repeat protein